VRSRFQNTGQSCIATKRIIVEEPVASDFTEQFLSFVELLRLGDPRDPDVTIGPVGRADLRATLERQVDQSVAQGARVLAGGKAPERPGFYYEPTVLDQVEPGMPVLVEEVFGPVVPIVTAPDAESAIAPRERHDVSGSGATSGRPTSTAPGNWRGGFRRATLRSTG
jgi:acyl-CoA reductase-like NAD-dependent aldehyde dehydrogenase